MIPSIRPATEEDIPAIQAVGAAAWRDTYTGLVPEGYLDEGFARSWTHEGFVQTLASQRARLLVAEQEGVVVGVIQLAWNDEGIASLWRLYLRQDVRGQGLGRGLWTIAVDDLPPSIQTFRTSVVRGNPALRFYQRLGFRVTHEGAPEYVGFRVPLVYLEASAPLVGGPVPSQNNRAPADEASAL